MTAADLDKARDQYDLPVDQGLQSFHCDVGFDWQKFIEKASNQAVPENDARLNYLRTIHLSIDDDLHGAGKLNWNAPAPPPDNTEDSVSKLRDGMQQIWSGFFQSWNGFASGDLMTLDARAASQQTADGYHVAVQTGTGTAEELFDTHLLLRSVHVTTPTLESTLTPTFTQDPRGKFVVTSISSVYRQPPTATPTEIRMELTYAPVGSFQLPSSLHVVVGPASFEYKLSNCTTQTSVTRK